MGGRMSRNKGARAERALCMELTLMGYDAKRVIRTRAVRGYSEDVVPDVEVYENGAVIHTFEAKARKHDFRMVYKLYEKHREGQVWRYHDKKHNRLIAIGGDFNEVKKSTDIHFANTLPATQQEGATFKKIVNMEKWLKGAQFLAIKDNNRNFLFIRYWAC